MKTSRELTLLRMNKCVGEISMNKKVFCYSVVENESKRNIERGEYTKAKEKKTQTESLKNHQLGSSRFERLTIAI